MNNRKSICGFGLGIGILAFAGILRAQSVVSPQKAANRHAPFEVTAGEIPAPCAVCSASKKVTRPASIATITTHQTVTLTPNPVQSEVKCAWVGGAREIALIDVLGNIVQRHSLVTTTNSFHLATQGLPKGNYYVRVAFTNGTIETHPLAVQ